MSHIQILFCGLIGFASSAWADNGVVVLVPGFFNSPSRAGAPAQYFSATIVETIRASGYTPWVIHDLDPVGSVDANGETLRQELAQFAQQHPGVQLTAIAHSAGGLYLARALTAQPDLPVTKVATISTPYGGAELVDFLHTAIPGFNEITSALNLSNLREFESSRVQSLLSTMRIPKHIRWVALGSAQSGCRFFSCYEAQNLSWLLSLAWGPSRKSGDGVVSVESATGRNSVLHALDGSVMIMETWPDFVVPLEHWEVVLEASLFYLLNVANVEWIEQTQRHVYTEILQQLK